MSAVDVPVALLGYGTVGSAVDRLLQENADDIERATGHRLRVVRALVRDPEKERPQPPAPDVLTADFAAIRDDPSIAAVAEVMGGVEPTGGYVLELLRAGKPVVSANKQLVAREGAELFRTASEAGVQLRFEASVCAAIPVIKVLREALVVSNVHRVLGIVNGTTNFILTEMENGAEYDEALAEAQRLGYAEADPSEDVNGADAAAKMAILATMAFGSRGTNGEGAYDGIEGVSGEHVAAAHDMEMVVRLIGQATLADGRLDVRVGPALVDRHHPLARVEGAFNAVMLQGDAIREITLEGPGAGGMETASAVVADMVSVIGTTGTGFLQNDACWRTLERLPPGELRFPHYLRLQVDDRAGVLADLALRLAAPPPAERYRDRLPLAAGTPVISLGEGSTPLLPAPRLGSRLGAELFLKWEGANPTGSFKDRGMTVAVSQALAEGARAVVCASTGNTAASAAAYAARAGLAALVLQPAGAVAAGKVAQALAAGARLVEVRGRFEQVLAAARSLAERGGHVLVNSLNPHRLEGQKTAAFEIVEELGGAPDVLALPYGGGGNLCAYAPGVAEVGAAMPRLVAAEAAGRADTVASAIRIPEPFHREEAEAAVRASDGSLVPLT